MNRSESSLANTTAQHPPRPRRLLPAFGVALLICIVLVIAAWAILNSLPGHLPDFMGYWLGGRLLIMGENPYNNALWYEKLGTTSWIFTYPLATAVFFIPWGLLELDPAYTLWMFFSMVCILSGALLLVSSWQYDKRVVYLFPIFAAIIVFRPVIVSIRNGQIAGFLLLLIALTVILWKRDQWILGGVTAGLLMLKPNVGAPILVILGLYLLLQKNWRGLLGLAGINGILYLLGWSFDPQWLNHFLSNSSQITTELFGISPSLWGVAHLACARDFACTLPVSLTSSLVLVGIILALIYRFKPQTHFVICLAISCGLIIFPYIWAYDHVLLLAPILIGTGEMAHARKPFLLTSLVPLLFSIIALALLGLAVVVGHDVASLLLPALCLVFILWAIGPAASSSRQP